MKRYFLIGLPGSGKSHWGEIWSEKFHLPFFDLDEIIENNEGFSIKEIFENEGEEYFRNLETFYLNKLIDNYDGFILSTGGGTPCFNENINLMNAEGASIFLDAPVEKIAKRIWLPSGGNKRPLLSHCKSLEDVQAFLNQLRTDRLKYYNQAVITLKTWGNDTLLNLN
jgi:shikimate kinase